MLDELAWPRGRTLSPADLVAGLGKLAELADQRGATELGELARAVIADPDSPDRLYDLGYALIDAGAPAIAASVLWACLALVGDSEEVVCELVSALESALCYPDACALLEEHAALRARSFLCQYLYAFNAAMSGRLDITRGALVSLVPDSAETDAMRGNLTAILERADRVALASSLDGTDLRGWQYALTGTLVLHQSPYGFDDAMHGRYAWLQDSVARVVTGLERLVPLVRATGVPCVYAPPGPLHDVVAEAVAARLGIERVPWPVIGTPAPGLIVAYDLADVPAAELGKLLQRREDQILFAHASPWTFDLPVAPDVTTLLYQAILPPEDMGVAALTSAGGLDDEERAADQLERLAALVGATWPPPVVGVRSRMWAGGPVPSNRFT